MDYIVTHWVELLGYAAAVVAAASVIAKVTPNKTDDKYVAFLGKFVRFLSLNTPPVTPKTLPPLTGGKSDA